MSDARKGVDVHDAIRELLMDLVTWVRRGPVREVARSVSRRSRAGKVGMFRSVVPSGSSVLVVGASPSDGIGTESAVEKGLLDHAEMTCLVYAECGGPLWRRPTLRGDARALPFADKSFDYVVSNAVIEHLGGPEGALRLIRESERVARFGWLHTTPNRWHPVEPHVMIPFVHWLPEQPRQRVYASLGFHGYVRSRFWPFSTRELRRLGADVSPCTGRFPAMTLTAHSPSLRPRRARAALRSPLRKETA